MIRGIPPIYRIFLYFAFLRILTGVGSYIYESTGEFSPPLTELFWTQVWQLGETLILAVLSILFLKIRYLKLPVYLTLFIICLLLIFWSIADPIVLSIAGDHLTPSLLSYFAGPQIFLSDDLWLPIKKHFLLVISGILILLFIIGSFFSLYKQSWRSPTTRLNTKTTILILSIGILFISLPMLFKIEYLTYPPEVLYLRDYFGWNQYQPNQQDIEQIRSLIDGVNQKEWESNTYPIIHKNIDERVNRSRPDIVLIVLESLRAKSISLFNPTTGDIDLPNLNRIAKNGITFPYFISNGFPSTEGFFSLLTGTWPHSKKRIAQHYQNVSFDNLATHLENTGYRTIRVNYDFDGFEEGYWVRKFFNVHLTFSKRDIFPSEKTMVDETIQLIQTHDLNSDQPIFLSFKTQTPHYPYPTPNDLTKTFDDSGTVSRNYRFSMLYVDKQIGRLYDYINSRKNSQNTVVLVVGDHSNYLDKATATALPIDEVLWTGAIIAGNKDIIGPPGIRYFHCSQIDITPTILYLAGDQSRRSTLGKNLLNPEADMNSRFAFAVRPSGIRMDAGGYTYIVDRRHPSRFIQKPAFDGFMPVKNTTNFKYQPADLLKIADTWSYLVEKNRVWTPELTH